MTKSKKNTKVVEGAIAAPVAQAVAPVAPAPVVEPAVAPAAAPVSISEDLLTALKGLDETALKEVLAKAGKQVPAATPAEPAAPADLKGVPAYSGFKPASSEELATSEDGGIRIMKEVWPYTDRRTKKEASSVKISIRTVFRKQDGNLYFGEPIAKVKLEQWPAVKALVSGITL